MSCTLAYIAACFSLSGFYIDTEISFQDARIERTQIVTRETRYAGFFGGVIETGGQNYTTTTFDDGAANPYGRLTIGYSVDLTPSLVLGLRAFHDSSLRDSKDRGINGGAFYAMWRPFGGSAR